MAYPRVFISSTCYDLKEVRDTLFEYIEDLHYIPVLSDKGDVFYHPDIHTHDSCIHEIETCQLFVLIIGGRFGGTYKADVEKSIVNAEYESAVKLDIPIITFINRSVYEDHRVYIKNKKDNPDNFEKIIYPSIENQKYAIKIFQFIDKVRKAEYNNAVFPFEFGREIKRHLGQQWAAMLFDFLRQRKNTKDLSVTNNLISDLTLINEKTEQILNKIYHSVDKENATEVIEDIDEFYDGKKFLLELSQTFPNLKLSKASMERYTSVKSEHSMAEFLMSTGDFMIIDDSYLDEERFFKNLFLKDDYSYCLFLSGDLIEDEKQRVEYHNNLFQKFKKLDEQSRREAYMSILNLKKST